MALEEGARSCLLRFRHRLEQDIKPSYLMDHMISDGVLTVDEEERISNKVSLCSSWEGEGEIIHNLKPLLFIMFFSMLLLFVPDIFQNWHTFATKYDQHTAFVPGLFGWKIVLRLPTVIWVINFYAILLSFPPLGLWHCPYSESPSSWFTPFTFSHFIFTINVQDFRVVQDKTPHLPFHLLPLESFSN